MFMVAEMRKEKLWARTNDVSGCPDSGLSELRCFQKGIVS
jgi:hypothetical protein